jgi:predicted metalloendopeptidase
MSAPAISVSLPASPPDPCEDFYQYACGEWMRVNAIPSGYSRWMVPAEMLEKNLLALREILEKAADKDRPRDEKTQQIGDYYASCMDEEGIAHLGLKPIERDLRRIRSVQTPDQLIRAMAEEDSRGGGAPFWFADAIDLHDSHMRIAAIDQSGLGMPGAESYLSEGAEAVRLRGLYKEHVTKMLRFSGDSPEEAAHAAESVLEIETALAKVFMGPVERRDPKHRDHMMSLAEANALVPHLHLDLYFAALRGLPRFERLNVTNPDFLKAVDQLIETRPLNAWKGYMIWHLVEEASTWLPEPFTRERRAFLQAVGGQRGEMPRWKRCAIADITDLHDAAGRAFAEEHFNQDDKKRVLQLIDELKKVLAREISESWMGLDSRNEALAKLSAIRAKIGFPDKWQDSANVKIVRGAMLENVFRINEATRAERLNRIGKPVEEDEWTEPVITVDAFYSGAGNEIVFPAGGLQPPIFDKNSDDAANYGAIGARIGHELVHPFDDQGRKRDARGNLRDWWSAGDAVEYTRRTGCFVKQYSGFLATENLRVNGELTLGENIADQGGVQAALAALHRRLSEGTGGKTKTPDEPALDRRFFLAYARTRCENTTPETSSRLARTDVHAPARWRVNGVLQNIPEFQRAFGCTPSQPMVPETRCRIW